MRELGCLSERDVKINQQRVRAIKNVTALLTAASVVIGGVFAPASTMAGEKRNVKINQLGGQCAVVLEG